MLLKQRIYVTLLQTLDIINVKYKKHSMYLPSSHRIFHRGRIYLNRHWWSVALCNVNTLSRDKMDAISQTTFSNAFSWMKMLK